MNILCIYHCFLGMFKSLHKVAGRFIFNTITLPVDVLFFFPKQQNRGGGCHCRIAQGAVTTSWSWLLPEEFWSAVHGCLAWDGQNDSHQYCPDLRAWCFLFIISLKIVYLIRFVCFIFVLTKINLTGKAFCLVKRNVCHRAGCHQFQCVTSLLCEDEDVFCVGMCL